MTDSRSIELVDFVLLACHFSINPSPDDGDASRNLASGETPSTQMPASPGIEVEGARLNILTIDVEEDENEFVFVLRTTLNDPASPYELSVVTGSRFTVPEPAMSTDDAASTLLFISYPYVREVVFSISSRSPFSGFRLPPLTRRPAWDPSRATE